MQATRKMNTSLALSIAVTFTLAAKPVHSAVLTLYYDNIYVIAPDAVTVLQTYNYASTGGNYSEIPTTINIAVGDTFEFGIDAVVTDNVNPDAGNATGTAGHIAVQPSFLGLNSLSIKIPSTDTNASTLVPNISGPPYPPLINDPTSPPRYNSTASLNNNTGLGTSVGPNNNPEGFVPTWTLSQEGEVSPTSPTGGDVGDLGTILQNAGPVNSNTVNGANILAQYGAATATFGNATDFFDSLSYSAIQPGTVTLSPIIDVASSYWTNTQLGSSSVVSGYFAQLFKQPGGVISNLPDMVIDISPVPEPTTLSLVALGALGLLARRRPVVHASQRDKPLTK